MDDTDKTFLITAMLPDRVGILRDITGVIFLQGGNLTDLRQTIIVPASSRPHRMAKAGHREG